MVFVLPSVGVAKFFGIWMLSVSSVQTKLGLLRFGLRDPLVLRVEAGLKIGAVSGELFSGQLWNRPKNWRRGGGATANVQWFVVLQAAGFPRSVLVHAPLPPLW